MKTSWATTNWALAAGKLAKADRFYPPDSINCKVTVGNVIQVELTEELKRRTNTSPDYDNALYLTSAASPPTPNIPLL